MADVNEVIQNFTTQEETHQSLLAMKSDAEGRIEELRKANAREQTLVELLSSLCSLLIAVPGHPQHGPFYLATGALNVIQKAEWRLPSSKVTLYAKMLDP